MNSTFVCLFFIFFCSVREFPSEQTRTVSGSATCPVLFTLLLKLLSTYHISVLWCFPTRSRNSVKVPYCPWDGEGITQPYILGVLTFTRRVTLPVVYSKSGFRRTLCHKGQSFHWSRWGGVCRTQWHQSTLIAVGSPVWPISPMFSYSVRSISGFFY